MPTYTTTLRLNDNIISVTPLPVSQFSTVRAYEYNSIGVAPNVLHSRDKLQTPDGTDLNANAIFFETRVNNNNNPPIFTQQVIDGAFTNNEVKVHEYQTFVTFSYPGIVELNKEERLSAGSTSEGNIYTTLQSPTQSEIKATVYEFIQTSNQVSDSDYTYDSSNGLWAPNNWASIKAEGNQDDNASSNVGFFDSQDFRGYRCIQPSGIYDTLRFLDDIRYNNRTALNSNTSDSTLTVTVVDQGPPNPIGKKFVLDIDISPAFIATDGTPYYKKTIIVSDTIPNQTDFLPYS